MATGIPFQRGFGTSQASADADCGPTGCGEVTLQWSMVFGKTLKKDTGRKENRLMGPSKEFAMLMRRWQRMKSDVWYRAGNSKEKHGLPAANHRASRRNGWSHFVPCLLTLQQFSFGGLHCAVCGGQCEWIAPNRILVVQPGTNANEAKEFEAHAAPQGYVTV